MHNQPVALSRTPFPASQKIYVNGTIHPVKVAMRRITLTDTRVHGKAGEAVPNDPVVVYDTSGAFSDPDIHIDVSTGIPRIRETWISDRKDVEQLSEYSSPFVRTLMKDGGKMPLMSHTHKPLRAKAGQNVTQ